MKVSGYKSHDAHVIMEYLLQVAVRKVQPREVSLALIRLGNFFRAICSKVIRRSDLAKLQAEMIDIHLHVGVKTRFSRYQMEDDEDIQAEGVDFSHMFSKTGHPIRSEKKIKGKTFEMDIHQWSEAHRYALFNTGDEQVEAFIKQDCWRKYIGKRTDL
ncbi:hypothetical protein KY284_007905 [Solanum tuberosum]|nr:hypothetical protein KY284_007905 [Solanum tuberosum]